MADKINKEECISRVYQFLNTYNGDWKTDADRNGDGVIIKTEFSTFMKTSDFDWDGLESKQDDVITAFWKSIDINTTGKLNNGKNISDRGALNGEELAVVGANIVATDIVNRFMQTASMPDGLKGTRYEQQWFNSVKAGMVNNAAEYLKKHKDEFVKLANDESALNAKIKDMLGEEKLKELFRKSAVKATADYKANEMKDMLTSEYGNLDYKPGSDKTLDNIINSYIKGLNGDEELDTICKDIENIINAYMKTIEPNNDESVQVLTPYGYNPQELNPLQKAVIKSEMTKNIVEFLKTLSDGSESLYDNNKSIFDEAVSSFIDRKLSSSKSVDFEDLKLYDGESFKSETEYTQAYNTIFAKRTLSSENLYNSVAEGISQSFADKLFKKNEDGTISYALLTGEFPVYEQIQANALEKAKNGDFGDISVDSSKLIAWIVNELKAHLSEFYSDNWNDMSLSDLNTTYQVLEDAAISSDSYDDLKKAACNYCKAVCARTPGLKSLVEKVFNGDYNTYISNHKSSEIKEKMAELTQKVLEMGDANTFELEDSSWEAIRPELYIAEGQEFAEVITPTFKNGVTVSAERITYKSSNPSVLNVDSTGLVTYAKDTPKGSYTATLSVIVDGVEVGKKTVKIEVKTESEIEQIADEKGRSSADYTWCAVYNGCRKFFDHLGLQTLGTFYGAIIGSVAAGAVAVGNAIADAATAVWDGICDTAENVWDWVCSF